VFSGRSPKSSQYIPLHSPIRAGEAQDAEKRCRQQQPEIAGVGQQKRHRSPDQEGIVAGGDVEDPAEHRNVEHEAGKGHQGGKLGEITRRVAASNHGGDPKTCERGAEQNADLRGCADAPPVLVE
jgi:hypothetical protein